MSQKLTLSTSSTPTNPPLPPALISSLSQALLHANAVPTIHATLLHECQSSGFLDAVRERVREILRDEKPPQNGSTTSRGSGRGFGELMHRVMSEIVVQTEDEAARESNTNGVNGHSENSTGKIVLPRRVVQEGIKVVREALDGAVEVIGED